MAALSLSRATHLGAALGPSFDQAAQKGRHQNRFPCRIVARGTKNDGRIQQEKNLPAQKDAGPAKTNIVTAIPGAPLTERFPVPVDLEKYIEKPWLPRANQAVSKEKPEGTDEEMQKKKVKDGRTRTVLQQHVDYFDQDGDGIIFPKDTMVGFRRMGANWFISIASVPLIHGAMSYSTLPNWVPDLRFPIHTDRMHKAKHGSDSEVYDTEGRFVPQKFEEIFSKFDRENKGGLTWDELQTMVFHMKNVNDSFGHMTARLEWGVTWVLLAENDLLSKEKIRGMFDGSIFYHQAEVVEAKRREGKAGQKEDRGWKAF